MTITPRKSKALRSIGIPEGFRVRGEEVSRVEGFSDAAFAFALTLLVISLEMPRSFDDLLEGMKGLPAFAVCFAMLVWLWITHYKFFRRYGLEDTPTIALNSILLFVIMFYVYPLKFVFIGFIGWVSHGALQPAETAMVRPEQMCGLFVLYGVGFSTVFLLFGLLNLRAWRLREALQLNDVERIVTQEEMLRCASLIAVGALSAALALVLSGIAPGAAGLAGFAYGLSGASEFVIAMRFEKRRAAALEAMRERGEWPPV